MIDNREIRFAFADIKKEYEDLPDDSLNKFSKANRLIGRLNFLIDKAQSSALKLDMKKYRSDLFCEVNILEQKLKEEV